MAASTSKVNRASCNSGSVVLNYFDESKGIEFLVENVNNNCVTTVIRALC